MINLNVGSLNCRGSNNIEKRTLLFNNLQNSQLTIICLQETKLSPLDSNKIKTKWHNQKILINSVPGGRSGTIIMFNSQ